MSVRRSLAWAFSGQAFVFTTAFIGSLLLARILTPSEMGVYAVATAVSGALSIVAAFGIGSYVIKETDLTSDMLSTAFTVNLAVSLVLASGIFLVSGPAAVFLHNRGVATILRVIAISPLLGVLEFRPTVMLQRTMNFRFTTISSIVASTSGMVATLLFAISGFSYMSMAYALIIQNAVSATLNNIFGRSHVRLHFRLRGSRQMLIFGLRMMTISGVASLAQRLSDLIMGRTLGVATLGIYSRASSLSSLLFYNIYGTATRVVFVQLSNEYRETGRLGEAFLRGFELILALMWPLLLGIATLSGPAIHILYGHRWDRAALPLSILMLSQMFTLSFGMNWELYVLRNDTARQTKYEVVRSGLGTVLFAIGCQFNMLAATFGRLLDQCLGALFYIPQMSKLADIPQSRLTRVYKGSALLALVAVLPSAALMAFSGWAPTTSPLAIAATVAAGIALWFLTLRRMRHPLFNEVRLLGLRLAGAIGGRAR